MMRYLINLILLCITISAFTQKEPDLTSPRKAAENLFDNQTEEGYNYATAAKSLYQGDLSDKEVQKRAKHLIQIFKGRGISFVAENFTVDSNYTNDETQANEIVLDTLLSLEVFLKKYDDRWLVSESGVEKIPSLYKSTYPFGTHKLLDWLSAFSGKRILGFEFWQILGVLLVVFVCVLSNKLASIVIEKGVVQLLIKFRGKETIDSYVRPITRPVILLLIAYLLTILVPILQFDLVISHYLILGVNAAVPLFFTVVFYKFVDVLSFYFQELAKHTDTTLDDQLVPLIRKTLKVFVIIIGFLFVLQNLNFNVTALLAGLSIGGLAFALASQDMIKNLFGSIMIFVDRPFQIGDWIIGSGIDGSVEEVGFRSTRVRTFANSVVSIPNGKIADMVIDNMGMREYRRYKTTLTITYDTPTYKVEAFVEGLKQIIELHPATRKDYYHVVFNGFGASSLDILLYVFFKVPDWGLELKARHEFNLEIMSLADTLGVRFAFNTQTLHVEDFPEKGSLTPEHKQDRQQLNNVVATYQPKNFNNED